MYMHSYTSVIDKSHIDILGHMNNAAYLQIFEKARWQIFFDNGYKVEDLIALGQGPVVLEIHLNFLKEVVLGETVLVKTAFALSKKKIGSIHQTMADRRGHICCKAEMLFGIMDLELRKLIEITEPWTVALGMSESTFDP